MKNVLNLRYFFYPFLFLLFGLSQARNILGGSIVAIVAAVVLIGGAGVFLCMKKHFKFLAVLVFTFLFGGGLYYIGSAFEKVKVYDEIVSVQGRVTDSFSESESYYSVVLDDVKIDGTSAKKISLCISKTDGNISIGDKLSFESELESVDYGGKYASTFYRSGVGYKASVSESNVTISDGYLKFGEKVRLAVKNVLYSSMSESSAGISYGVLFGDKSGIDSETKDAYRDSGVIHILTVSGLHVGFLIGLVYGLLKLCKANRYVNFVLTTIFIFFYAYLCGFSPSVLRAGLMGIIFMLSKLFAKNYDFLNSLGFAGIIILLFRPLYGLDTGFLMSVACVLGIALLLPAIERGLNKFLPYKVASPLAVSLAVQVTILPFTLLMGSKLNFLTIFANLFIVPLFSVLFPLLFVIAFLCTILPFLKFLFAVIEGGFIAITFLAKVFSIAAIEVPLSVSVLQIVLLYGACLVVSDYMMIDRTKKFFVVCCMIFVASVSSFLPSQTASMSISFDNSTNFVANQCQFKL
jgi:competence protein ComEC